MLIPNGATIAVADGEKLTLFKNSGSDADVKLRSIDGGPVKVESHGSGARHHASSANPDHGQLEKDGHAAAIAALLNREAEAGAISHLIVVADPKTLGELRKHFSKRLSGVLVGEVAKDLVGQPISDLERAIAAA